MLATQAAGAFARGQMAFGQMMQICAEGEPVFIRLDAEGNPINAAHSCPECLAATAGMPPAVYEFAQIVGKARQISLAVPVVPAHQDAQTPRARGPPVVI